MDDRTQHGYPQPGHADPRAQEHAGGAPWPSFQQPAYGQPINGHAPYPGPGTPPQQPAAHQAMPTPQPFPQQHQQYAHAPQQQPQAPSMQYQYTGGFVMPGAAGAHAQPMSAHGGTIGQPPQQGHPDAMPMLHGGHAAHGHHAPPVQHYPQPVQQPPAQAPMAHGAVAMDPYAQPQAWAYPTPDGLQLVQAGPHDAQGLAATATARRPGARRMKWETIVPGAAVACLVGAIALFISDFDRITGREALASDSPARNAQVIDDTDATGDAPATTAEDADAVLDEAAALYKDGRFEDAANLLVPMLDVASPDARIVELNDRIETASARNSALLAKVQRHRRAKQWPAVLVTIRQLEALRPLSPSLTQLRAEARAAIKAQKAAAAKRKQAAPSNSAGSSGGGAGAAPRAGGSTGGSTDVRPPASAPSVPAVAPTRPPTNPVASGGGGIGAAPTGSNCHTHGTVTECH